MPKTKISEFSATPANNTDIDSINIAEGCAPSGINDAIRELMAQLKDFQTGAVGDSFNGPVGTTTAAAGAFTTLSSTGNTTLGDASGDSVTINGTATFANANPTLSAGTANGVAYLNGSKVVTSGSALTFDGTNFATTGKIGAGGSPGTYTQIWSSGNVMAADGSQIGFLASSAGAPANYMTGSNTSNYLAWIANNAEQMRLTSTGLGIGTSSPAAKLQISSGAGGDTTGLRITRTDAGGGDWRIWATATANGEGAGKLVFGTSSNLMMIDGSGNLGLGVTPSPWETANSVRALQFNGGSVFSYSNAYLFVGQNFYRNSGGVEIYINTAAATKYQQAFGAHQWYNAPSGTAGNGITFTQAATLTAGGDFLVGTTTSAARLTVQGVDATASNYAVRINNSAGTDVFRVRNDGYFITGSASQSPYNLTTASAANVNIDGNGGLQRVTSSLKYKRDVQNSSHGLNELLTLRSVTYKGKGANDGETVFGGLIAEEVHAAGLTEFVQYAPDGTPDALAYGQMVSLCIKAIQELKAEFDAYKVAHP